jgi:methionine synthase II (cobalamin-independent)
MVPTKVHLVGSIALDSVEEVFRTTGTLLGRRLRRVPDGEPGGRRLWISWQYPLLRSLPFLKADPSQPNQTSGFLPLQLAEGFAPGDVRFPELGYAREARASYQDFLAARQQGHLPPDVRFQVSLPTPFAVINPFCAAKDAPIVERAYEEAMVREVESVCRAIPHKDLCIQWDVCIEMVMWDGRSPFIRNTFEDLHREIELRMKRLASAVPSEVELGFHLCYGDWEAKHFVEPADSGKLTEFANLLAASVDRPISYIHMPVPIDRSDDGYFQPLRKLKLSPDTELFLGLVHSDGVEATRKRIETAARYVPDFGIATECGMARCRTPELVRTLLMIHAEASREPAPRVHSVTSEA